MEWKSQGLMRFQPEVRAELGISSVVAKSWMHIVHSWDFVGDRLAYLAKGTTLSNTAFRP